jgi:LysR family transcriptional regulator, transcriptional activator AphB
MLDDLALFVAIVDAGSLNAAAAQQGLPAATVTRRLQKLEAGLGYRLLNRSARRTQPTAEGWQYYEQCRPLVQALRQATQRLDATLGAVSGNVRVLAPINLATSLLTPAWAGFMHRHPAVSLELELSNAVQDLVGSGADLAIRVGSQQDSLLTQRLLGRIELALVASPDYLAHAGTPLCAVDLAGHAHLVGEPMRQWHLRDPVTGVEEVIQPQPRMRVNELRLALDMAEAALGIVLCPMTLCRAGLRSGALTALLPQWMPPPRPVYALWSQQRYLPARVRALLEYLAEFCAAHELMGGAAVEG